MSYVDVAVIPVAERNIEAYKKMAKTAAKYWMKHGALHYYEAMGDDVPVGKVTDFQRSGEGQARRDRRRLRRHHEEPQAPRRGDEEGDGGSQSSAEAMKDMPFDGKRMIFGGFKPFVELEAKPEAAK